MMKKFLIPIVTSILLAAGCKTAQVTAPSKPQLADALLWKVSGKGGPESYLFGTFHLVCKEDINMDPQLKAAVAASKKVYFEMNMDDPAVMMGAMSAISMKDGKMLTDLLTAEQYERLHRFYKDSIGVDIKMMNGWKPFFLSSLTYTKLMPCKATTGMEAELLAIAKQNKLPVSGLETMQDQMSIFDKIPYDKQALELLKGVDSFTSTRKAFDDMYSNYKAQKIGLLAEELKKSDFQENSALLLQNRNNNWMVILKQELPKNPLFVAVGAAHLIEDDGLINLLRKEGYTVEPVYMKTFATAGLN